MTTEELKKYDFIVLVDKSGSMSEEDCPGGKSRWDYAQENVLAIAKQCEKYDDNGITVGVFSNKLKLYENVTDGSGLLKKIFSENQPGGTTDTAGALSHVIEEYLATKGTATCKPIIVVIITDGIPDDEPGLVRVIVNTTKKISTREEIGLEFIQIGTDKHAHAFLDRLDNNMTQEGATLDIVNAVTAEDLGDKLISDVLIASLTE
jgi:uncharacterized protein with von Willebrand factor type A (vWA) domain